MWNETVTGSVVRTHGTELLLLILDTVRVCKDLSVTASYSSQRHIHWRPVYLSSAARQTLIKDIGIHASWTDPSEPFQLKFLLYLSPCSATIFLRANISKFICGFFLIEKKIKHTFHFLTWISSIYLMTFFTLKHQLFLSKERTRHNSECTDTDSGNILIWHSEYYSSVFKIKTSSIRTTTLLFLLYIVFLQVYYVF